MDIKGFFRKALGKTKDLIAGAFQPELPEEVYAELEDRLILADAGPATAAGIIESIQSKKPATVETLRGHFRSAIRERFSNSAAPIFALAPPTVWFVFGTNGAGKTTTAAKIASFYKSQGSTVGLVAADTFRAAAIDQLRVLAGRAGSEFYAMEEGAHPSAVIFDALSDKTIRSCNLVIVDTAGRLHTKTSLMEELAKMTKSCEKTAPGALTERLLVLDGTAGQNALVQAKTFHASLQLTGLIVTKLDASAKAGFLLAIRQDLPGVPVKWVGVGETLEDIAPFDPDAFVDGLVGSGESVKVSE